MKHVKIYKPLVETKVVDGKPVVELKNKKGTFVEIRTVMDRTLDLFVDCPDKYIIDKKMYMEETEEAPKRKGPDGKDIEEKKDNTPIETLEEKAAKKRAELSKLTEDQLIELAIENDVDIDKDEKVPSILDKVLSAILPKK